MSCLVWLPLFNDFTNYGIGNISLREASTVKFGTGNGKISNKFMNYGHLYIDVPEITGTKEMTFMFWAYVNSSLITDNWTGIAYICDQGTNSGSNMRFEVCPKENYDGIYCFSNHNDLNFGLTTGCITSKKGGYYDQWVHFCFTSDGTTFRRYMNGVDVGNCPYDGQATFSGIFILDDGYKVNKQDCRIYDTCLSPKEISEIAKGMVCHYPLNDIACTASVNKYSGENAEGLGNFPAYNIEKLENEQGYNYKLSYTGNGGDNWLISNFPFFSFTPGKTYDYSLKIRVNKCATPVYIRAARCSNDWFGCTTDAIRSEQIGKGWIEYHLKQTLPNSFTYSGTTYTTNPRLEFCTEDLKSNGVTYNYDFDIKDVQISECDTSAPFMTGSFADTTVYDTSGFGNHGSVSGKIYIDGDTPRNDIGYNFNQSGHILKGDLGMYFNEFSIAYWVKIPSTISAQHFIFGTFNNWTVNGIGAWRDESSQTGYSCIMRSDAESTNGTFAPNGIPYNTWTHIAYVYTGTEIHTYRNGVLIENSPYGKNGRCYMPNLILGNSTFGNTATENDEASMSDFRLYATALSADAIKQLYNSPISVTNTGVLMTQGEFKEE